MDRELLKRYALNLDSLVSDIVALEGQPTAEDASALYALLQIHSHGFAFADAQAHHAALRCIEWGATHAPLTLSQVICRRVPAILEETSIADAASILAREQKGFLALHNGEDWVGIVEPHAIADALRYELGHVSVAHIAGDPPALIDIDAPMTLARELLRRSTESVLMVIEKGRTVGYVDAESLLMRLRTQVLPDNWVESLGEFRAVAECLSRAAEQCGNQLYLVGGGVRDVLLGGQIIDLDCSIVGDSAAFARVLTTEFGGQVHRDEAFGAVHWTTADGQSIDITSARTEQYPNREDLPVVSSSHLRHDLRRRDFTLNAMAIALHASQWGELIDAFGGYADLKAKQLRVLHGLSFLHDPTRMLRAARYASRFELVLADNTRKSLRLALAQGAGKRLSRERLGNELQLLFSEKYPVKAFEFLMEWGCVGSWLPELASISNLIPQLQHVSQYAQKHGDDVALAIWLVLSKNLTVGTRKRLERLTATTKARHQVWVQHAARCDAIEASLRVEMAQEGEQKCAFWGAALQKTNPPLWAVLSMVNPEAVDWWRSSGQFMTLAIDGALLQEQGLARGPQLGAALKRAWAAVWMGGDKSAQLQAALQKGE